MQPAHTSPPRPQAVAWPRALRRVLPLWPRIAGALAIRWSGWIAMMALALYGEGRAAPHLPDVIIDRLPYLAVVDRYNHYLLALSYLPIGIALLFVDARRFCRYNISAGFLSLLRGICIAVTGLGPVRGSDIHANLFAGPDGGEHYLRALLALSTPQGLLWNDAAHLYLTKDLFFSGHTAATLLLLLYVWPHPRLRWPMLVGHVLVVASVFFAHLHYTIDVLGAYAFAYALFAWRERRPGGPPPLTAAPAADATRAPE